MKNLCLGLLFAALTSGEKALEPTGEKALEPTGEKALEPTGEKALEPTGEKALEPTGEKTLEPIGVNAAMISGEKALEPMGVYAALTSGEKALELTGEKTLEPTEEKALEPMGLNADPNPKSDKRHSYSMEHFRWGKHVGRKRRSIKVYISPMKVGDSSKGKSNLNARRQLGSLKDNMENEGAETLNRDGLPGKKKHILYVIDHFRWARPYTVKQGKGGNRGD
ncbi:hypothetical protein DPEC_G00094060 [Dallia pectoralis]|uniref:Uncharacterized protein n=1 Tax=Dallia pectoralis TaxID=75939 RepID=A0ACC2H2C5_DALPE|nr:hypothetical protein DPEC_G00094060 [Dallia pectoralis]